MSSGVLAVAGPELVTSTLREVVSQLDLEIVPVISFENDLDRLESSPPNYFIINYAGVDGQQVCIGLRMSAQLADLPIIVVVKDPWSEQITQAFSLGADDFVLAGDIDSLEQKLIALRTEGASVGTRLAGKVVLADPGRERRLQLARYLRKMGFDVYFSVDVAGIPDDPGVKLIVCHTALPPIGVSQGLKDYRKGEGKKIPWIICGDDKTLAESKAALSGESNVHFFDVNSDPAQIVSSANQLLIGAGQSMRRSPRLQYGTPIRFGTTMEETSFGFTYNINRGGLYVRTITPPGLGIELNLEFKVPHGRGRVEAQGKVVWRQEYSPDAGYPPGFGLQYTNIPLADKAAIEAGYNKLLEESGEEDIEKE